MQFRLSVKIETKMEIEQNLVGSLSKNRRHKSKRKSNNNNNAKDRNEPSPKSIGQSYVNANGNNVTTKSQQTNFNKTQDYHPEFNIIALDCEMVGAGLNGERNMLARVSIVNVNGDVIMDKYVKPTERIVDYRTPFSGITAAHLKNAHNFSDVKAEVRRIKNGKILVGHSVWRDLEVLKMNHPQGLIRDTAEYRKCRSFNNGQAPSLRLLANRLLNCDIQNGAHCSVEDAQTTMAIYKIYAKHWESSFQSRNAGKKVQLPEFAEANKFWISKANVADAERNLHILKNSGLELDPKKSKPKNRRARRRYPKKKQTFIIPFEE